MVSNEALQTVIDCIVNRQLGKAIALLENYLYTFVQPQTSEQLEQLKADYKLMTDYWMRGFDDPEREMLYEKLLRRLYVLTSNVYARHYIRNSGFVMSTYNQARTSHTDWSPQSLRQNMESFVSDVALLELEPEHIRKEKSHDVYEKHIQTMGHLFDYIWTSKQWSDGVTEAFGQMLLTPTIDARDQQLMVSAITLSLLNFFDFNKFRLLLDIYCNTQDEYTRQRALIGWVLCMDEKAARLYPEIREMIGKVTTDERCCDELAELQMQLVFCMTADQDNRIIRDEIWPELMKNNNIRVTRNGIEEVEDDPMDDILHPEISEQRMEKLEKTMQRMIDMQKQGSDIYFGGFSQMKRFPFFNATANWFIPFFLQHPAIDGIINNVRGKKFLQTLLKSGPFCDSDKYSFVIAYQATIEKLPAHLLDMMDRGEATLVGAELESSDTQTPAFIRRSYLQNLYRFFRVFPSRSNFRNPFEEAECRRIYFFANKLLQQTGAEKKFGEVVSFFMKHKIYDAAKATLENYRNEQRDELFYLLNGTLLLRTHGECNAGLTASDSFACCLELNPDNERAWSGCARSLFAEKKYEQALHYYRKLAEHRPGKQSYLLNEAVCLTNLKDYEAALKILYKLNYEDADNINVSRVLAWALVGAQRYEQAEKLYQQLLDTDDPLADDLLNAAYMKWFNGNRTEAVALFRKYAAQENTAFDATTEFMVNESALLSEHGLSEMEVRLMIDQLL